ncbi:MAG: antibiotic biosynthesis monooxygenase [Rhodospirillaceae bacterium]|nr:MAG: antibiotic biosynthesis monooxygenase [Rhodospirillaceae bacterium]
MYVVVVNARVRPEKADLYEATFRDLAAKVRAREPGVLFYELCKDPNIPHAYILIEAYKDQATQAAHVNMDYYKASVPTILDCLTDQYDMKVCQTI